MDLINLPELAIGHVASFLGYEDVISMRMTCSQLRNILPKFKKVIFRGNDFKERGPRRWPEHYFDGPFLADIRRVVSLKISMTWRDQGWGDRRGEVWIQLVRGDVMKAECKDAFGVADHAETSVEADISTKDVVRKAVKGDNFKFMRNVGGGGGHMLTVKDFTVHMVTIVDKKKEVGNRITDLQAEEETEDTAAPQLDMASNSSEMVPVGGESSHCRGGGPVRRGRDGGRPHGRDGGRPHGRDGGRPHGRDGGRPHGRDGGRPHGPYLRK